MGAAEDYGVYFRIFSKELVYSFFHEVVGTRRVGLVIFHQWHPEWASLSRDLDVGPQLMYLHVVALALHRSFGCEQSDMIVSGDVSYDFSRWPYDAEHASSLVPVGQVVLLDRA